MRFVFALLLLIPVPALGQIVTTIAGSAPEPYICGYTGDGGPAVDATLCEPQGLAFDAGGNLYIADALNHVIRRVTPAGIITTVAGNGTSGFSGDGGPATQAQLSYIEGIAVDAGGNVFLADHTNNRIRRVDAQTGIITTVAGSGAIGFSGDGGPATIARLNHPQGVAVHFDGNLYIADAANFRIRKVNLATGVITTFAGNGVPLSLGDGGLATSASFSSPRRVAVDFLGNVYIVDRASNNRVRRVDGSTGIITTLAGGGNTVADYGIATQMFLGGNAGPGVITDVAADTFGGLLVTTSFRLYVVFPTSISPIQPWAEAIAGTGAQGYGGDGGDPMLAVFNNISGVATNSSGAIYLSDRSNQRIRRNGAPNTGLTELVVFGQTSQMQLNVVRSVEGDFLMNNIPGRTALVAGNLEQVGQDVSVQGNADLAAIQLNALISVGDDLIFQGNPLATHISLESLASVGGSLVLETQGQASVDLSSAIVGGSLLLTSSGASSILAQTAQGASSVNLTNGAATLSTHLPAGTFPSPVPFTISHVPPGSPTAPTGAHVDDPGPPVQTLAAYDLSFANPTLDQQASLAFTIDLDALDTATRDLLDVALAQDRATLAFEDEALGGAYHPLLVCQSGQTPAAHGCVEITYPSAHEVTLACATTHFSTWAAVIVAPGILGVDPGAPRGFALHPSQPNPFSLTTSIGFDLPRAAHVTLRIYDVRGRLVRSLAESAPFEPGTHQLPWDGRLADGRSAGAGVFFYAIAADGFRSTRRMVVLP